MSTELALTLANQDAEASILSALMLDHRALTAVREMIQPDAFYRPGHRRIYDAMLRLHDVGAPLDMLSIADDLQRREELHAVGGKDFLLSIIDAVPTAANVSYHANIVRTLHHRRQVVDACRVAQERAVRSPDTAQAIAQDLADQLLPITSESARTGYEHVDPDRVLRQVELRMTGSAVVYPTYLAALDRVLAGGFWPKELVIIGGVAKIGKSALAHAIALATARHNVGAAIVSAEMSHEQVTERMLSGMAEVRLSHMATGSLADDEIQRLANAGTELRRCPLWIDDAAAPTLTDVIARGVALKTMHPEVGIIVVDFLQLIQHKLRGRRGDEELTAISYGLKSLAKRTGCCVIAPTQLNYKEVEARPDKRPTKRDLQGSSGMLQAADWVMLMHRPGLDDDTRKHELELIIDASRRTSPCSVNLSWDGDRMTIRSPKHHTPRMN